MTRVTGIVLTSLLLCACGGGGGGSGGGGGISTGKSSSSITSSGVSSSIDSACGTGGTIFEECLNKDWGVMQVWQQNSVTGEAQTYRTETNPSNVQWKLVDSPSVGHSKVLQVSYQNQPDVVAHFNIASDTPQDRKEFANGKLKFDLNVQDFGTIYNQNTGEALFEIIVECGWPCTSHSYWVPVNFLNQWQTVELDIADMVRDGLDLSRVDSPILIRPSAPNGQQSGVVFQLDNIKWVKGSGNISLPKDIYAEHFNSQDSANQWSFVAYAGGVTNAHKSVNHGLNIVALWQTSFDHWAMETTLTKAINIRNKTASIQIRVSPELVGAGHISFSLAATDGSGIMLDTGTADTIDMEANEWYEVEVDLGDNFSGGFNPANVRKLSVHFYANGKPPYYVGVIAIDTIRITE
ncbi:hypothetical protein [Cellvibrio mixtus]|uniref:hypothetical protein n=1 Tax=Cellvibrio mixtus TaxID=39650 RepID=UPI0005874C10|nr:hypothetical protein [Cellvibrio mixtus]